jgi:hypothetical protein
MSNLKSTYWTENDLKEAIDNLQNLRLTPDEHTAYVMTLSYNAIGIQMAKQEREVFGRETAERVERETTEKIKKELVMDALKEGQYSNFEICNIFKVSLEFVEVIKKELNL